MFWWTTRFSGREKSWIWIAIRRKPPKKVHIRGFQTAPKSWQNLIRIYLRTLGSANHLLRRFVAIRISNLRAAKLTKTYRWSGSCNVFSVQSESWSDPPEPRIIVRKPLFRWSAEPKVLTKIRIKFCQDLGYLLPHLSPQEQESVYQ